ncbi:MAG TPA: M24 family metallopeptidase [Chloroflexota bacterium]|nr:M24 family metallopeptidase [Chloroflexota bacterium]
MIGEAWSPDWSNAVFSLAERDRRWRKARELMARDGIDAIVCLPWTSNHDRGQADPRYLTQLGENSDETTIVFPLDGEVTAWHSRGGVWPSSNWFTDIRAAARGTGGASAAGRLKELRLERGTIGIAGLTGGMLSHCRITEGEQNWQSVEIIKRELPNAKVVSATDLLGEARYQKSEAEIDFLRRGTAIADKVLGAIVEHARPGVAERAVWAEMLATYGEAGGSFEPMFGWISGPQGNVYHRIEQPTFRVFRPGDQLTVEIDGRWGGYIAQIDQTFALGRAAQDLRDGMKLAYESFNRVFAALKPGVTVGELLEIGTVEGMGGRGVARLTMHGRGTGDDGPLVTGRLTPELRAIEMKENCVMVIKPSATVDGKGYGGNWGETVAIRSWGAERLGAHPQYLYELA